MSFSSARARSLTAVVSCRRVPGGSSRPVSYTHLDVYKRQAYDLGSSLDAIAPAVGPQTSVMPILNGLLHYAALDLSLIHI